jgi:uncharacterized protein YukE
VALAKRKIVAVAFDHLQEVNARTSLFLSQFNMTDRPRVSSQHDMVGEAVTDVRHPRRVPAGPGPLLLINADEENNLVVDLSQMLLHDEVQLRKAAVRHFQELSKEVSSLTPKSKAALKQLSSQISKAKPASWREAAVQAFDTLQQDFFCSLAAFKQCLQLDYRAGITEQAKFVFWPSLNSVDSIDDPLCTVSKLREDAKKELQGKLNGAKTLENALTKYFRTAGHLPLTGEMSAAGVVAAWIKEHKETDVWTQVWRWGV